jgi:hypothetical protein
MTFAQRTRAVTCGLVAILATVALIGSATAPAEARRAPRVATTYAGSWQVRIPPDPPCVGQVAQVIETSAFRTGTFRGGSLRLDLCGSGTSPFSINGSFKIASRRATLVGKFTGSTDAWTFYRGELTVTGGKKRFRNAVLALEGRLDNRGAPFTPPTAGTIRSR